MYSCPTCHNQLIRTKNPRGWHYVCSSCRGRMIGLGVLRKSLERESVNRLWRLSREGKGTKARPCPVCKQSMNEVVVRPDATTVPVDVCERCLMMWFDGGEWESMPRLPEPPPLTSPKYASPAKQYWAIQKVKQHRVQAEATQVTPDLIWKYVPAIFGYPVEMMSRPIERKPFVTIGWSVFLFVIFLATLSSLGAVARNWGFVPALPYRSGGLTLLTYMLLHGGWMHIIGNTYFLMVLGNDVENNIGRARMLGLLLFSGITGALFHMSGSEGSMRPLIGASASISGIIAYYALRFPHARIGILFLYFKWIRFPAYGWLILWTIWQVVGAVFQLNGEGNVSYLAHIGGAVTGFAAWLAWRKN